MSRVVILANASSMLSAKHGGIMPVEDHLKFDEWKSAQEKLAEATAAQKRGEASKLDVSLAQMEFNKICDEIDDA